MAQVVADDAGGEMCRRLLAPTLLLPLLLGWLRTLGERAGLYDASLGWPLLTLALIVSFTALVW